MNGLRHFHEVWLADFEFSAPDGERPTVACLVAREFSSGRLLRFSSDQLINLRKAPFATDSRSLFVAFFASAEINCFLSLGWPVPERILDLWVEQRCLTNGRLGRGESGLLRTLMHYGLDSIAAAEKQEMRELAMRGGPYTVAERDALLDYCQTDVDALAELLPRMIPRIDLPRALLRGRYMAAVARMEQTGTPIDTKSLNLFRQTWGGIKQQLISEIDQEYGVFEGQSFRQERFAKWLIEQRMPWPRTPDGRLALDQETFRQQARKYPEVAPLRELRHSLSEMKLEKLSVGSDGRNRCLISPFGSRTGRNQPSNNRFIFGPSVWIRGLIKPQRDRAVAYVDWSQQELGIAAALSGDPAMMNAYSSGDPYLAFAKQAGAVPNDATKASHPVERNRFKVCALAVQYGMQEHGLAQSLGEQTAMARNLLRMHRETYRQFWRWSQFQTDQAMLLGWIQTVFGWRLATDDQSNPRSLANFPMQGNGAEMLRLACCMATEDGIHVCAPVHDAILVEGPVGEIDQIVERTRESMAEASRFVLNGFTLGTDAQIVRWPERFMDEKRGEKMWQRVTQRSHHLRRATVPPGQSVRGCGSRIVRGGQDQMSEVERSGRPERPVSPTCTVL